MKYFDSHAHYYDKRFEEETEEGAGKILDALFASSVSGIVNVGTNAETSRLAAEQAKRYPGMFTAIGIHPEDCEEMDGDPARYLSEIESLIRDPANKCVALGEIGLDYHVPDFHREKQLAYFHLQMELARRLDLPVCVHDREAHGDVMEVVRAHPGVIGVMHSFSGSAEMAKELIALGWYISFSGTLTFTNARKPKEAAALCPKDRVLIETDAPYLAPHPERGTLNHSGKLVYTNAALAQIFGISPEDAARLTEENARRLFRL